MKTRNIGKTGTLSTPAIIAALGAIEQKVSSIKTLNRKQRRTLKDRERVGSEDLTQLVLQEADKQGGEIAGMTIDVVASRDDLSAAAELETAAESALRIAARLQDEATQRRGPVTDRAFAIYTALRRLVRTPEGESFARAHEDMAKLVRKTTKRARAKRTQASNETPAGDSQAPQDATNGAPKAAPQAPSDATNGAPKVAPPAPPNAPPAT